MTETPDYLALSPEEDELVARLRKDMVNEMQRSGAIASADWLRVFRTVPRHAFMPQYFQRTDEGFLRPVDGTRPEQRREWLTAAYQMTSWTTQIDARPFADFSAQEELGGEPTNSTTQPDVMAAMLEALQLRQAHRVLEIGTGTGYNAALLSERLGSEHVVSTEIDAGLAEVARQRLAWCGYAPTVATGDGLLGYPEGAPYDRVISTAAVPAIPSAWVEQTRPGGLILANLSGGMNGGGLALLTVRGRDLAEGRFLPDTLAFFMPVRSARVSGAQRLRLLEEAERQGSPERPTPLGPDALEIGGFDFLARLVLKGATQLDVGTDDGGWVLWLLDPRDGSAAAVAAGPRGATVTETGPRRLWMAVEEAYAVWQRTGCPGPDRFGLSVTPEGQYAWLDTSDSAHTWPVPAAER